MGGLPNGATEIEQALALAREHYAGSSNFERIYGAAPTGCRPGLGLCVVDQLLIPADLAPLPIPVAVFTGRDHGEARWVTERLAVFGTLLQEHLWHNGNGVEKPDPASFLECLTRLAPEPLGPVLYLGDLAADAELVRRYRALKTGPEVVFALVGDEGPAELADLHVESATELLESLRRAEP
jgi:phosphoglycolate phosphatase-like HAD superfamily hydrolase